MSRLNFGTSTHPVYVDSDSDSDLEIVQSDINHSGVHSRIANSSHHTRGSSPQNPEVIDDDISFMFRATAAAEEELERDIIEILDDEEGKISDWRAYARNGPLSPSAVSVQSILWHQETLKVGDAVEVTGFGNHRYIRISDIIQDYIGITLRGIQYVHMDEMQGMLPWNSIDHHNEVCAIYHIDLDDPRPHSVQAAVEIALESVVAILKITVSNTLWPIHASADPNHLVCRWKYLQYFPNNRVREKHLECYSLYKDLEAVIIRNDADDADPNATVTPATLQKTWYQSTPIRGGSYIPARRHSHDPTDDWCESQDLENLDGIIERIPGQKYTFFDAFCGAGGASRGARRVGLHLKYAIDAWDRACDSYKANFRHVKLFRMKVDQWIREYISPDRPLEFHCDILHLSPPCQVFSPAHTINSYTKDEANFSALFACETIIDKIRPRIFTLEQTFGLLHRHWRPVFYHLLASFTGKGYSVRWKYVFLPQWGLPAKRKRLIMIGAGPGESLPTFPEPTHREYAPGESGCLPPLVTVRQALSKLDPCRNDPLHRPQEMKRMNMPKWDTNIILNRCVTTSGGQNYHYSGRRCFTHREFALLQGFPTYHEFVGSFRIRQIGNAFPPCTARVLYGHIERWLLKVDGVRVDEEGEAELMEALAVEIQEEDESYGERRSSGQMQTGERGEEDDLFEDIEKALEKSRREYREEKRMRQARKEEMRSLVGWWGKRRRTGSCDWPGVPTPDPDGPDRGTRSWEFGAS